VGKQLQVFLIILIGLVLIGRGEEACAENLPIVRYRCQMRGAHFNPHSIDLLSDNEAVTVSKEHSHPWTAKLRSTPNEGLLLKLENQSNKNESHLFFADSLSRYIGGSQESVFSIFCKKLL